MGSIRERETFKKPPLYVAIHEAGHAVAMMFADQPRLVDHISIRDTPDDAIGFVGGKARFQLGTVDELHRAGALTEEHRALLARDAWQDVIEFLAGPLAELRFRKWCAAGRAIQMQPCIEAAGERVIGIGNDDFEKVFVRLDWIGGDLRANIGKAREATETVLRTHWNKIEKLGRWLHRDLHIEGEALHEWRNQWTR